MKFEIKKAKYLGFCSGVRNAVKIAQDFTDSAHTFGPLIHNEEMIKNLEKKNIDVVEDIKQITKKNVIIRAHGIEKKDLLSLEKKGVNIIDCTCPLVKKCHEKAQELEKKGYHVVIFGDAKHPEIKAIVSYLKDYTVCKIVPEQFIYKKIGIISQTTQNLENFNIFCEGFRKFSDDIIIENTICNATKIRQDNAVQTAKDVDLMLIIGGAASSNTKRLYELCSKYTKSRHIQTYKDLNKVSFKNINKIGITAGASTPNYLIEEVIEEIKKF
jgi:4-hydroxy-3-methylbut-2-en-1-yl diphosphate reductase